MAVAGLSATMYLDENAPPRLVSDLGRHGYDIVHAWDAGNREISDEVHLRWATDRNRAVFTFDVRDFRILHQRWASSSQAHTGIILCDQIRRDEYGQLVRRLLAFLDQWSADDLKNQALWLPHLE